MHFWKDKRVKRIATRCENGIRKISNNGDVLPLLGKFEDIATVSSTFYELRELYCKSLKRSTFVPDPHTVTVKGNRDSFYFNYDLRALQKLILIHEKSYFSLSHILTSFELPSSAVFILHHIIWLLNLADYSHHRQCRAKVALCGRPLGRERRRRSRFSSDYLDSEICWSLTKLDDDGDVCQKLREIFNLV